MHHIQSSTPCFASVRREFAKVPDKRNAATQSHVTQPYGFVPPYSEATPRFGGLLPPRYCLLQCSQVTLGDGLGTIQAQNRSWTLRRFPVPILSAGLNID